MIGYWGSLTPRKRRRLRSAVDDEGRAHLALKGPCDRAAATGYCDLGKRCRARS